MPETRRASTLERMGAGPKTLVVHGGPGFDHRYLKSALGFLADHRELVFYDQPGCGSAQPHLGTVSLSSTALDLVEIIELLSGEGPFSVVTHSWGALVLAAAVASPHHDMVRTNVAGGVLLNPLPMNRAGFDSSYQAFAGRIPAEALLLAEQIAAETGDGDAVMKVLWRYYSADPKAVRSQPPSLKLATYGQIMATLGAYDFTCSLEFFGRMSLVTSTDDFTDRRLIANIGSHCRQWTQISDGGHFPMLARRDAWASALIEALAECP